MFRKWNRFLAFLLSLALVITTFGSDLATAKVYAEGGEIVTEQPSEQTPVQEETAPEIFEEIPEVEEVVEEVTPPAVEEPEEVIDGVDEEVGEEDPENPEGEDPENPEDEDEAKDPEEEPEVAEGEEKFVTVTYESGFGGSVSKDSESIDINKEDAAFEGATATPWNDKYTFANWTKDGEVVSEEATFVPADITEDTTFKANFKAAENIGEEMPSINESKTTGGMNVSVSAPEGLFPKGTTVSIEAIGDDEALATAQEAIPEATAAKGVDITFRDADGNEIQPANNKYVSVTMSLAEALEGDNFAVVHDHGDVETIGANISTDGDGNATEATFASGEFSIFIVAAVDDESATEKKVVEYKFFTSPEMTEEFNSQFVKKGDTLVDPGVPASILNSKSERFIKWKLAGKEEGEDKVPFGEVGDLTSEESVINVIPVIEVTYFIQFHGLNDEVEHVAEYKVTDPEDANQIYVNAFDEYKVTADSGTAFVGWSTSDVEPKSARSIVNDNGKNVIDVTNLGNRDLFAVVIDAYWIHFEGNGSGATYTEPTFLEAGQTLSEMTYTAPTRSGYEFAGWSLAEGDDNVALTEDELNNKKIEEYELVDKTLTLHAVWTPEAETSITVVFWQQKATDKYDTAEDDKEYDFKDSFILKNVETNVAIDDSLINSAAEVSDYKTACDKGFEYNKTVIKNSATDAETDKAEPRGNTIVNVYFDRTVITITFNRYGSGEDSYEETTDTNSNETYYGTDDGQTYYALTRDSHTEYYVTYRNQPYTGTVYYYNIYGQKVTTTDYSNRYRTYYGTVNGQEVTLTRNRREVLNYLHNGQIYTGTRYRKISGTNDWHVTQEFKGLYGQTLAQAGYEWPNEAEWYDGHGRNPQGGGEIGTGIRTTFLDTFFFDTKETSTTPENIVLYGNRVSGGNVTVSHYKEDVVNPTGNKYTVANSSRVSGQSTFYLSNKYEGFELEAYQHGNGTRHTDVAVNKGVDVSNQNLNIYYKRLSYELSFIDIDPTDKKPTTLGDLTETVKFEGPLGDYADKVDTMSYHGYQFKGWYKDAAGQVKFNFSDTMPANNVAVYGIWEPTTYSVTLLANGGEIISEKFNDPE